ncbi:hypothetical protein D3H35_15560 [Cohnella faecalis]|uniref:Secreted protein n=2 Tax=Cohnella faecalis TaxID=2315694 RepID=A0A398CKA6_9BACL|nr:hypothetical protein D3H35_15560 [Cohnella faecalis]
MEHSSGHEESGEGYAQVAFAFDGGKAKANEDSAVTIRISDSAGNPVKEFKENHEKLLHLIIVDHDLATFSHIHPDYKGDGTFTVTARFPSGGQYKLFADFVTADGTKETKSEWVNVEGAEAEHAPLAVDDKLVRQVDGQEVELTLSSVKAKEEAVLTFDIRDAATKQGIDDLQPYLGAVGHVVIISEDGSRYLHVHPVDEKAKGPKAEFMTTFPESGIYKIWGQFQRDGAVFTVPFVVKAE